MMEKAHEKKVALQEKAASKSFVSIEKRPEESTKEEDKIEQEELKLAYPPVPHVDPFDRENSEVTLERTTDIPLDKIKESVEIRHKEEDDEEGEQHQEEEEEEEEEEVDETEEVVSRNSLLTEKIVAGPRERHGTYTCCMCKLEGKSFGHKVRSQRHRVSGLVPQPVMVEFSMCGCRAHFGCYSKSRWSRIESTTTCPSCSEPNERISKEELRQSLLTKEQYKPNVTSSIPHTDAEKKKLMQAVMELLIRTRKFSDAAKHMFNKSTDFSEAWKHIKSGEVKFDDFIGLGWDMSHIYHYITKDVRELKEKYGFTLDHLKNEKIAIGLATIYNVDQDDLKVHFRDQDFGLPKLKELQLSPITLNALGLDTHQLLLLGLKKDEIRHFPQITMADWVLTLNFVPLHIKLLGIKESDFDNPSVLGKSPKNTIIWTLEGLRSMLDITPEQMSTLGLTRSSATRNRMSSQRRRLPGYSPRYPSPHEYHHAARRYVHPHSGGAPVHQRHIRSDFIHQMDRRDASTAKTSPDSGSTGSSISSRIFGAVSRFSSATGSSEDDDSIEHRSHGNGGNGIDEMYFDGHQEQDSEESSERGQFDELEKTVDRLKSDLDDFREREIMATVRKKKGSSTRTPTSTIVISRGTGRGRSSTGRARHSNTKASRARLNNPV